ncbi:MAG TPA: terpene cyclase/mutase family protein, partial [Niabella sp.]|nr:terpene cyclase/mutase family protein [Niabella sp.]
MNTDKKGELFFLVYLLGAMLMLPLNSFSQNTKKKAVLQYVQSLQRNGCEYGWPNQYDGHITPTFAAIGVLHSLQELPQNRLKLIQWVETHHPQTGVNKEGGPSGTQMRDIIFQQIQTVAWLGGDLSAFKKEVAAWRSQRHANSNFEETKFGNLWQESFTPITFSLLNIPVDVIKPGFTGYLDSVRRPNGSYNNALLSFGKEGDGNILCTVNSILALRALKKDIPLKNELVKWLQACQDVNGGFKHQPQPELARHPDIIYTWAGVKALKEAGAKPADTKACISYILSLQNDDGGFGNKPGLASTPMSAYYAVDALKELNALEYLDMPFKAVSPKKDIENFKRKNIYTVQFQSVGNGSPKEAVFLAKEFKIDLWGAKNSAPGWIEEAQRI